MSDGAPTMDDGPLRQMGGERVWVQPQVSPVITEPRQANDLLGDAMGADATWVALRVSGLSEDFFDLRTGMAGEITQKVTNLGMGLAVVGDVSGWTAASKALRDFVFESNRRGRTVFVADLAELERRLSTSVA